MYIELNIGFETSALDEKFRTGLCHEQRELLENVHRFSRKSQWTRTRAWQKLHVQNDPNWAEFIIDASTRTCVRAFNTPFRGACIAIMLHASQKNVTIQLHQARRKMIRIIQVHLHFYLPLARLLAMTHARLWGKKSYLEIQVLLRNISC